MHYDACILAPDGAFSELLALECADARLCAVTVTDPAALPTADLFLVDADAYDVLPPAGNVLFFGTSLFEGTEEKDGRTVTRWRRPFSLSLLRRLLASGGAPLPALSLLSDGETVRLGSTLIPLSPTEYALLSRLLAAGGAPVSREELYAAVWGAGEAKEELVNLYIHYLRRKLEGDGRRRILSLRGRGYALREEGTE